MAGNTARAYRSTETSPRRNPRPVSPQVRVKRGAAAQPISPTMSRMFGLVLVAIVVFAVLAVVRVGFSAGAIDSAMASEEISAQIDSERSLSTTLEVRESYLSNPTYVRQAATERLKMTEPTEVSLVALPPDVVSTDDAGALSLSKTLSAAEASE